MFPNPKRLHHKQTEFRLDFGQSFDFHLPHLRHLKSQLFRGSSQLQNSNLFALDLLSSFHRANPLISAFPQCSETICSGRQLSNHFPFIFRPVSLQRAKKKHTLFRWKTSPPQNFHSETKTTLENAPLTHGNNTIFPLRKFSHSDQTARRNL